MLLILSSIIILVTLYVSSWSKRPYLFSKRQSESRWKRIRSPFWSCANEFIMIIAILWSMDFAYKSIIQSWQKILKPRYHINKIWLIAHNAYYCYSPKVPSKICDTKHSYDNISYVFYNIIFIHILQTWNKTGFFLMISDLLMWGVSASDVNGITTLFLVVLTVGCQKI